MELLRLMKEKDDKLAKHLKESTVFVGTPNRIQNDPTETSDFVRCHIKSDINAASFVAVKVDETTDKNKDRKKKTQGHREYQNVLDALQKHECTEKLVAQASMVLQRWPRSSTAYKLKTLSLGIAMRIN